MNIKKLVNFIFELGQLKKNPHQGWSLIGLEKDELVASHVLRSAQIGYFLAKMEGYKNSFEIVVFLVFHDIEECRIGDFHKVANRYVKFDKEKIIDDQLKDLIEFQEIKDFWKQVENKNTTAGKIAKDADLLEQAFTAKELIEKGYYMAQNWINNVEKNLKTKSAKKLLQEMKKISSNDWWQELKKI
ncbi:MAG: HD domain-containing protein [Patescibacteria group bacterium]|nr:HD domain-containing protein [Patescibacteria group bacterium]